LVTDNEEVSSGDLSIRESSDQHPPEDALSSQSQQEQSDEEHANQKESNDELTKD
jgi:hypothetical protein